MTRANPFLIVYGHKMYFAVSLRTALVILFWGDIPWSAILQRAAFSKTSSFQMMALLSPPIFLSWREPNPYRLSAHPFGYFCLFCLDGRQPTCAKESRKYLEKHIWQVPCSFAGADFCSGKAKLAESTAVFSRALTQHGRKSARQNRYVFDSCQLNHRKGRLFWWKLR